MSQELIVIGNTDTGKTALSKWLTTPLGSFSLTELNLDPTILTTHEGEELKIHECGGKSAFNMLRLTLYKKPNISVILLCFALNDKDSWSDITAKFIPEIKRNYPKGTRMPPVFLIGTKDDMVEGSDGVIRQDKIVDVVQKNNLACYLNVSAKNGKNMVELKGVIVSFQGNSGTIVESNTPKKKRKKKKERTPKPKKEKRQFKRPQLKKRNSVSRFFKWGKVEEDKSFALEDSALPIHRAIHSGDLEAVQEMLAKGVNMNSRTKHMNTPLHYATGCNQLDIVKELVKIPELDANLLNVDGMTPLAIASKKGHSFVVQCLIAKGKADMNKRTKLNALPVDLALNSDTMNAFLAQKTREQKFCIAVKEKDLTSVKNYVDYVDIDCVDDDGKTALEIALDGVGCEDILELMTERSCHIKEKHWKGNMFYEEEMKKYWYQKKRDRVFVDILQDEKVYTDILDEMLDVFVIPIATKLKSLVKDTQFRKRVSAMLNFFSMIQQNHNNLCKDLMRNVEAFSLVKQPECAVLFKEMQLDYYLKYVEEYLPLTELVVQHKELEKFGNFLQVMEKKTGVSFWKTMKIPSTRLHKYKGQLQRLIKDCCDDFKEDKKLMEVLNEALDRMKSKIEKMDMVLTELKGKNMMMSMSKLMSEKYGFDSLLDNEERSYVYHEMDVPVRYCMKPIRNTTLDVFFFNDRIFLGEAKRLGYFSFSKVKVIIEIGHDSLRFSVFDVEGSTKPQEDFIFHTPMPRKWSKPIVDVYGSNPEYYYNKVFLINHEEVDVPLRGVFHALPKSKRVVDRMKVRETEIERLEDLVKRNIERNRDYRRKINDMKNEKKGIEEQMEKDEVEKAERKKKMMEMVRIQKERLKEKMAAQKLEEEEMKRRQAELQEKMGGLSLDTKKKRRFFGFGRRKGSRSAKTPVGTGPNPFKKSMSGTSLRKMKKSNSSNFKDDFNLGKLGGMANPYRLKFDDDDEEEEKTGGRGGVGNLLGGLEGLGGGGRSGRDGGGLDNLLGMFDKDPVLKNNPFEKKKEEEKKTTMDMLSKFENKNDKKEVGNKRFQVNMDEFDVDKILSGDVSSVSRGKAMFGKGVMKGLGNKDQGGNLSKKADAEEKKLQAILASLNEFN